MNNNDILRRVRYIFDFNHSKIISILALVGHKATREQVSGWLKKEDDPALLACSDVDLLAFLNGLIIETRGSKEGAQPGPAQQLTNNIVFLKLRIALNMQTEDVLAVLLLAGYEMSRHELSALFRKANNKHYRVCKDEVLQLFLKGLQMKYHAQREVAVSEQLAPD